MSLQISLVRQFDYYQEEAIQVCFSPDGNELWSSDVTVIYQWKRSLPIPGRMANVSQIQKAFSCSRLMGTPE